MLTKEFAPEQSSNVARIEYAPEQNALDSVLAITFRNGTTYAYDGVPQETWLDAVNAESIGKFVNANIKGKFEARKVEQKGGEDERAI